MKLENYKIFSNVSMGISVPKEWENVLEWFADEVEKGIKMKRIPPSTRASQVKEKYDSLRIYYSPYSEEVEDLIDIADAKIQMMQSKKPYHFNMSSQRNKISINIFFAEQNDAIKFFDFIKYEEVNSKIEELYSIMKKE